MIIFHSILFHVNCSLTLLENFWDTLLQFEFPQFNEPSRTASGGGVSTKLWGRLHLSVLTGWQGTQRPPPRYFCIPRVNLQEHLAPRGSPSGSTEASAGEFVGSSLHWWESGLLRPAGASALGHRGFQLMLVGACLLRTCVEVVLLKEKVRKSEEKAPVCGRLLTVSVFREPRTGRAWCGKVGV